MSESSRGPRVLIAGGGVFGVTIAHTLSQRGVSVMLVDPGRFGENASGVAAGMLAPAFESLLDPVSPASQLLQQARDLWPELAASTGIGLDKIGAMALASPSTVESWIQLADRTGIRVEKLTSAAARERAPWLACERAALWTPEDWRLESRGSLKAIWNAAAAFGARWITGTVAEFESGPARLSDGRIINCDALIIATGKWRSLEMLAPELKCVSPIKGHILRFPDIHLRGPVVRVDGVYICPSIDGAVVGSTMEAGRDDIEVDSMKAEQLRKAAAAATPRFLDARYKAEAGVRASTVDGLPIVGRSTAPGVWIAVGARRNGWLLAPMVAGIIADSLAGAAPSAAAMSFDPARLVATV